MCAGDKAMDRWRLSSKVQENLIVPAVTSERDRVWSKHGGQHAHFSPEISNIPGAGRSSLVVGGLIAQAVELIHLANSARRITIFAKGCSSTIGVPEELYVAIREPHIEMLLECRDCFRSNG